MHDLIPVDSDAKNPQVIRLMREALRCAECGAPASSLIPMSENSITPRFLIKCCECNYHGPKAGNLPDALKRWNKPTGLFACIKTGWIKK